MYLNPFSLGHSPVLVNIFWWPMELRALPQRQLIKTCNTGYQWEACSVKAGIYELLVGPFSVNIRKRPVLD